MVSIQQEVTVSIEDVNLNELLLTGKTDLNWTIDGKPQEALELSYVMQPEGEPEKLFSFIPAYYEQALVKREIEGYKQMKEENWQDYVVSKRTNDLGDVIYLDKFGRTIHAQQHEQWVPDEVSGEYVSFNDLGDSIDRATFDRLIDDAKQVILPYNPDNAVKFYPRTPLPDTTTSSSSSMYPVAQTVGFGEIRYDEATMFTEEAVDELMNRISSVFGIGGSEVGELYDNWKQEYLPQGQTEETTMLHGQGAQLGWFPNPASVPGIVPPPAAPVVKHEPEFGVVVANKAQVHSSTVNALSSGKFINEGERLDLSFKQYIVLFHNDDYNRNEAVQVRQQLRDLIPGVDVVMLPMNE